MSEAARFKSVICVGEDFTVDLTGPSYYYFRFEELYYRWDGTTLSCRSTSKGSYWFESNVSFDDFMTLNAVRCGNPDYDPDKT